MSWELVPQKELGPCLDLAEGSRRHVCQTQPLASLAAVAQVVALGVISSLEVLEGVPKEM